MVLVSIVAELAQPVFSFSRSAEAADAVANVVGVVAGTAVVALVGWWSDRHRVAPA